MQTIPTRRHVEEWLTRYERAWRKAGTAAVSELFSEDATYQQSPYDEPIAGLAAIADMWEAEREGPDEAFTMVSEILALEGHTAVIHVDVAYEGPVAGEYRDLWVIRFAEDGRCLAFEEWPFWPGQPRSAPTSP
jgi:ketosteroid isomerase-like protein